MEIGTEGMTLIKNARREKTIREQKGQSLIDFPEDYTVIDTETTGLDPIFDSIIEIGAIKVRNNKIVDSFSTLIKPDRTKKSGYISSFITDLTGISNDMIEQDGIPEFEAMKLFNNFIKEDILVGHNANFDINFLYDSFIEQLDMPMVNSFIDVLRIARRQLKELKHHRLEDLMEHYSLSSDNQHRAKEDCYITDTIFNHLKKDIKDTVGLEDFRKTVKYHGKKISANEVVTENTKFDEDNLCYGKYIVFTGKLEMVRAEAMQLVKDLGGIPQNNVTSQTDYLVLGDLTYSVNIKGNSTSKQKNAEKLKLKGQGIEVLSETVFYDMLP
ncbi:exonuclease domain-containing protein [Alkalibacterium sp. 20]|uniref:exonuclease domain-containing protein n=1 Tax=Alkalibacterium sp. 20 TaxID=1798803 RepID=UPI00091E3941|nr:exonuclease domain-containing protein [Alkalibacterium sp. 20]OJF96163.1 hypothetical protein AX762_05365 [Alkalibacterium sp. 20]